MRLPEWRTVVVSRADEIRILDYPATNRLPVDGAVRIFVTNPEPPAPPRKLSAEIDLLLEALAERPLRLREMIAVMQGRAYTLLLILISIPFCLPLPLPGLSTVLGGIIAP